MGSLARLREAELSIDNQDLPTPTAKSRPATGRVSHTSAVASAPPPQAAQSYSSLLQTVSIVFLNGAKTEYHLAQAKDASGRIRKFAYGMARGRPSQPLVFVIPGFGCPYDEPTALDLSETLSQRGFHVATLHSPSHPEFLLNSHHSGVPGVSSEDARDALLGIKAIRNQLRLQGVQFGKTHLIGYSMGALNAAFVRYLDREDENLFDQVVLINSPIDLDYGMKQLDSFLDAREMSKSAKLALASKFSLFIYALQRSKLNKNLQRNVFMSNPIWTQKELRALIGFNFEKTVAGGVSAAVRLGFMDEAVRVGSFTEFCETATVAHYQKFYPGASSTDLFHSESLLKIGPTLAADGNVTLLHNEDDFLLRPVDISWMAREFGANAHLFKTGGHLGNIWRDDFKMRLEQSLGFAR